MVRMSARAKAADLTAFDHLGDALDFRMSLAYVQFVQVNPNDPNPNPNPNPNPTPKPNPNQVTPSCGSASSSRPRRRGLYSLWWHLPWLYLPWLYLVSTRYGYTYEGLGALGRAAPSARAHHLLPGGG